MRLRAVLLTTAAIAASAGASWASGAPARSVSDRMLRVPLPSGWAGSVGPGMQGRHEVAWILAGNFRLAPNAADHEGTPRVPPGRVLIVIGDFFPEGRSRQWRSVRALHVPLAAIRRNHGWRQVRFQGRAVAIAVRFGSKPTPAAIARAERVLAGITREKALR